MTHAELITSLTARVRDAGPVVALDELRADRPAFVTPAGATGYHDTLAVFYVWAIERLLAAGLSDMGVRWHPLVDVGSPRAWWADDVLGSDAARGHFVPSTRARAGDPAPVEARLLVAA